MKPSNTKLICTAVGLALYGGSAAMAEVKISSDDGKFETTLGGRLQVDAAWCRPRIRAARGRLKAGKSIDNLLESLIDRCTKSAGISQARKQRLPEPVYDPALPIVDRRDEIIAAIRKHQVVVIAGETVSGKTTQIPKMCMQAGRGVRGLIGCTQPRRIAAHAMAERVAEELNTPLPRCSSGSGSGDRLHERWGYAGECRRRRRFPIRGCR